MLPPVPLTAESARLAVSSTASVKVAFPPSTDVAVFDIVVKAFSFHRGSKMSALKSKREKTRTKRRIEQYTQGRCST